MHDHGEPRTMPRRRGFALLELAVVVAVLAVLGALLIVGGERTRRTGRLGDDLSKLRQIGVGTASYVADNADLLPTYSWRAGVNYPENPYGAPPTDMQAAADQAVWLIRTLGERDDLERITAWIPHILYGHLPLVAYLGRGAPDKLFISSGDVWRGRWADDPDCFRQGCFQPHQPPGSGSQAMRWPFSASFVQVAAVFESNNALSQDGLGHQMYLVGSGAAWGGQSASAIAFPSQKVVVHDQSAWHFGARAYHAVHDQARLPLLFGDGGVHVRAAADANPGWIPTLPRSPVPTRYLYQPGPWEPPTLSGTGSDMLAGRFRWTRGGLAGRDFGGPEVDTGQP